MTYFFNEAARIEHLEHVAYYEEQRQGLGARYLAAFEAAMVKVWKTRSDTASSLLSAFGAIECRDFRTTSSFAFRALTSRFLWSRPIAVARAIGSAGFNAGQQHSLRSLGPA